jgi:hypothetical protein
MASVRHIKFRYVLVNFLINVLVAFKASTALPQSNAAATSSVMNFSIQDGNIIISGAKIVHSDNDINAAPAIGGVDISDRIYFRQSAKWPNGVVYVCWENPTPSDDPERKLVQAAVSETWQKYSALQFKGWGECSPGSKGVRILIDDTGPDTGPHTKGLGYELYHVQKNSMVLNFTFKKWSTPCQSMKDHCIRAIAVHEFGHAIGFAHEQNRPDTPGECLRPPQGSNGTVMLTPWDIHSVMNYCNPKYSNNGNLSEWDQEAVQIAYPH